MEVLKSKNIIEILSNEEVRQSFNKMLSCPCWHQKILSDARFSKQELEDLDNTISENDVFRALSKIFEKINSQKGISVCKSYFNNYYFLSRKKWLEKNMQTEEDLKENGYSFDKILESSNLLIFNDNSKTFSEVQLRPMVNLNDPVEGLWLYREVSYSTIYINQILKSFSLPFASYTTPSVGNELYMCSNYSRLNQSYISFLKSEYIKSLEEIGAYYGFVIYDKFRVRDVLKELRKLLKIDKKIVKVVFPKDDLDLRKQIYFAFEFMINMFYKWDIMSEEFEFRGLYLPKKDENDQPNAQIKWSTPPFVPTTPFIPILTGARLKHGSYSFKRLNAPNIFYKLKSDIKNLF